MEDFKWLFGFIFVAPIGWLWAKLARLEARLDKHSEDHVKKDDYREDIKIFREDIKTHMTGVREDLKYLRDRQDKDK